jgi:hypothetical protein
MQNRLKEAESKGGAILNVLFQKDVDISGEAISGVVRARIQRSLPNFKAAFSFGKDAPLSVHVTASTERKLWKGSRVTIKLNGSIVS